MYLFMIFIIKYTRCKKPLDIEKLISLIVITISEQARHAVNLIQVSQIIDESQIGNNTAKLL